MYKLLKTISPCGFNKAVYVCVFVLISGTFSQNKSISPGRVSSFVFIFINQLMTPQRSISSCQRKQTLWKSELLPSVVVSVSDITTFSFPQIKGIQVYTNWRSVLRHRRWCKSSKGWDFPPQRDRADWFQLLQVLSDEFQMQVFSDSQQKSLHMFNLRHFISCILTVPTRHLRA